MVTKYLCMVEGCKFVTEDRQEALGHIGSHPEAPDAAIAEISYSPDAGTTCSTFEYEAEGGEEEEEPEV